jgi:hypothetical protein
MKCQTYYDTLVDAVASMDVDLAYRDIALGQVPSLQSQALKALLLRLDTSIKSGAEPEQTRKTLHDKLRARLPDHSLLWKRSIDGMRRKEHREVFARLARLRWGDKMYRECLAVCTNRAVPTYHAFWHYIPHLIFDAAPCLASVSLAPVTNFLDIDVVELYAQRYSIPKNRLLDWIELVADDYEPPYLYVKLIVGNDHVSFARIARPSRTKSFFLIHHDLWGTHIGWKEPLEVVNSEEFGPSVRAVAPEIGRTMSLIYDVFRQRRFSFSDRGTLYVTSMFDSGRPKIYFAKRDWREGNRPIQRFWMIPK